MSKGKTKRVICSMLTAAVILVPTAIPASAAPKVKAEICHKPGTPAEGTRKVSQRALAAHMAHGDYAGPCATTAPVV